MRHRLEWIEAMRGLAALWVVFYHASRNVDIFIHPADGLLWTFFAHGLMGVDFFFVLSGFIIAYACERIVEKGGGWRDYVQARLVRIYVPYLPIGLVMVLVLELLPSVSATNRDWSLLASLTLLPSTAYPALGVAYTLVHEMIFYSVFSIFFISPRLLTYVLLLWAGAIDAYMQLGHYSVLGDYLVGPFNLCFLLGVVTFRLSKSISPAAVNYLFVIGGISIVLFEVSQWPPNQLFAGAGFALIILASASLIARRHPPGAFLVTMGAASYSIYLVHTIVLSIVIRFVRNWHVHPLLIFVVLSACGLAAGLLYHYLYEKKALIIVRNMLSSSTRISANKVLADEQK